MSCPVCKFVDAIFHWIGIYLINIAMWIDEGANVIILPWLRIFHLIPNDDALGDAHYTVSQWTAYAALDGSRFAKVLCKILTILFKPWHWNDTNYSHCYNAIHYDDGKEIPPTETTG
jgi:hypothetical protein